MAPRFDFYRGRLAGGLNVWRDVFVGPEAEAFGNLESEQQRLGVFAEGRLIGRMVMKASAGALHDGDETGAYGRLGLHGGW